MKTKLTLIWTVLALLTSAPCLCAQSTTFTYQGRVAVNGTPFTGTGQFKFALVTSTNTSQATATATRAGGFITGYTVIYGGSGYTSVPAVTVTGGGGSGATAIAHISGGVVTSVTLNTFGSGYTSTPTVTIAPPSASFIYSTYWSNDGTSSAGSQPISAVGLAVTNGLFTAVLGDTNLANMAAINAALFTQPNLQLLVWFNDGLNGFGAVLPAQLLMPVPYAAFANNASNLLGTLPAVQISGAVPSSNLSGTYTSAVTLNNAGNAFAGNGAGLTSLNASSLASGTVADQRLSANVDLLNASQTLTGAKTFSAEVAANSSIRLNGSNIWLLGGSDVTHGLGYYGTATGLNKFFGGSNPDGPVLFGYGGGALGSMNGGAHAMLTWTPQQVFINSTNAGGWPSAVTLIENKSTNAVGAAPALRLQAAGTLVDGVLSVSSTAGLGYIARFGNNNGYLVDITTNGNVGIGTTTPASKLEVNGQVRAQGVLSSGDSPMGTKFAYAGSFTEGTFNNWNGTGNNAACRRLLGADDYHCGFGEAFGPGIASPVIWMYESTGNAFEVRKVGYNQQVPSGQKLFAVHADGTTEVKVLEITGGSDLAEPFHVSGADIPKGSLVIIDEENPGQLKLSCEPYDHRVAGIISGANGINPGLTLHQQGKLDGGKNVALSGRVYALADATDEAIKPGDLLTSSSIPGHLMKASDNSRAHGAIVGKAMSALNTGKGMVLVLVSLQ